MEAGIIFVAAASLILLAVTSMRFGVDSRAGFASKERELAARGIVWGGSSDARDRLMASEVHAARRRRQAEEPTPVTCGA